MTSINAFALLKTDSLECSKIVLFIWLGGGGFGHKIFYVNYKANFLLFIIFRKSNLICRKIMSSLNNNIININ